MYSPASLNPTLVFDQRITGKPHGYSFDRYDLVAGGQLLGHVSLSDADQSADYLAWHTSPSPVNAGDAWVSHIELLPEFQKRHLARPIYRQAAERVASSGYRLRSDPDVISASAKHVWDRLVETGEASPEAPFTRDADGDYSGGLYVINRATIPTHSRAIARDRQLTLQS